MSTRNLRATAEIPAADFEATAFELPCHRSRPLRFHGRRRHCVASAASASEVGYALHLYETVEGRVVVTVEAHFDVPGHEIKRTGWKVGSPSDALSRLETYDAATDVPVPVDPDDPHLSAAEMIAHVLQLRARIDIARRVFRDLWQELADAVAPCDPIDGEGAEAEDVALRRKSGRSA